VTKSDKKEILISNGTYNKKHQQVKDEKFLTMDFYDPMDIVQVKYEMLKNTINGGQGVAKTAEEFGFSKMSYYNIKNAFEKKGMLALIPEKTGPKEAHKLTPQCQEYIDKYIQDNPAASSSNVAAALMADKGVGISKRTIDRYRAKKKPR